MGFKRIYARFLPNTVTIKRRTQTINEFGSPENTWEDIETGLSASIQSFQVEEKKQYVQGNSFRGLYKAYVHYDNELEILPNDVLLDEDTDEEYKIVGVQRFMASTTKVGLQGHHFKLEIEKAVAPSS